MIQVTASLGDVSQLSFLAGIYCMSETSNLYIVCSNQVHQFPSEDSLEVRGLIIHAYGSSSFVVSHQWICQRLAIPGSLQLHNEQLTDEKQFLDCVYCCWDPPSLEDRTLLKRLRHAYMSFKELLVVFVEGESEINQTSRECSCQSNCFFFFFLARILVVVAMSVSNLFKTEITGFWGSIWGGIKVIRETNVHGEILDEDGILYRILTWMTISWEMGFILPAFLPI